MEPARAARHCVRWSGVVSHLTRQRRYVRGDRCDRRGAQPVVSMRGARTAPAAPEVSRSLVSSPVDSTTTVTPAASSASTVETDGVRPATDATIDDIDVRRTSIAAPPITSSDGGGDAAAAEFTRSLFEDVAQRRSGLHGRGRAGRGGRLRRGVWCGAPGSVRADDRRHGGRHRLCLEAVHRHGDPAAGRAGHGRPRCAAVDVSARSAGVGGPADRGPADPS